MLCLPFKALPAIENLWVSDTFPQNLLGSIQTRRYMAHGHGVNVSLFYGFIYMERMPLDL